MDRGIGLLASEHEAWQFCLVADSLCDHLVKARPGPDYSAGREWCTGEQVPGLGTMNVPLQCLGVVEALDKYQPISEVVQK